MHLFKLATRSSGRYTGLLLLSLLSLFVMLHSEAAYAASLAVKIRQLNPAGEVQQVTCTPDTKCLLPIDIQTGSTKETLTVGMSFVPNNVVFNFQTPKGYLYAGLTPQAEKQYPLYETIWHTAPATGKPATAHLTLFFPLVSFPSIAQAATSVQQPVAEIEITTEQLP